jgi:hypothetical protein
MNAYSSTSRVFEALCAWLNPFLLHGSVSQFVEFHSAKRINALWAIRTVSSQISHPTNLATKTIQQPNSGCIATFRRL